MMPSPAGVSARAGKCLSPLWITATLQHSGAGRSRIFEIRHRDLAVAALGATGNGRVCAVAKLISATRMARAPLLATDYPSPRPGLANLRKDNQRRRPVDPRPSK